MIVPVTFELMLPSEKYLSLLKDCREKHHVPFGGIVYAGIAYRLYSGKKDFVPLDGYLDGSMTVPFKVVLSQFVINRMLERFIDRYDKEISASTVHILLHDALIPEWYRYQIEGSGSGKISKTK